MGYKKLSIEEISKIKRLRNKYKLSYSKITELTNISYATVYNIINPRKNRGDIYNKTDVIKKCFYLLLNKYDNEIFFDKNIFNDALINYDIKRKYENGLIIVELKKENNQKKDDKRTGRKPRINNRQIELAKQLRLKYSYKKVGEMLGFSASEIFRALNPEGKKEDLTKYDIIRKCFLLLFYIYHDKVCFTIEDFIDAPDDYNIEKIYRNNLILIKLKKDKKKEIS